MMHCEAQRWVQDVLTANYPKAVSAMSREKLEAFQRMLYSWTVDAATAGMVRWQGGSRSGFCPTVAELRDGIAAASGGSCGQPRRQSVHVGTIGYCIVCGSEKAIAAARPSGVSFDICTTCFKSMASGALPLPAEVVAAESKNTGGVER
jgi:hypothetical protein